MKYGINQSSLGAKCANCGNEVKVENFCPKCGAPLTISAIASFEEQNQTIAKNIINNLKNIAKQNNTNSFIDILKVYDEE